MFDPQTTLLIRQSPALPDLDVERLPEELTKAFAEIVAFRLRLGGSTAQLPAELYGELDKFRRLAATFEAKVAVLPELKNRQATAFVAAQAYHLLYLSRKITGQTSRPLALWDDAVAPEVSALLLFLVANQLSDATEMAREVEKLRPPGNAAAALLVDAVCALSRGNLGEILRLTRMPKEPPDDSCDAAIEALYGHILRGLDLLAKFVLGAQDFPTAASGAIQVFKQVQQLSIEMQEWPFATITGRRLPPLSTFAGPHHLASLLVGASDCLGRSALSAVPPPASVPLNIWKEMIRPITAERPFLWPNHLKALDENFLQPGTSAAVSFPTGAGKTTLSELKAASALALGGAVIYLAPTHALVAQIKADLAKAFPRVPVRDSLLVEDFYAEIGESFTTKDPQIVVMTPERCLALLSMENASFGAVRLVIFDECHLIHPKSSGQNRRSLDAMFAVLQLHEAAPDSDWLLLSAMMSNADEIAGWLNELTGRKCLSLSLDWKPTRQARGCLVYDRAELNKVREFLRTEANSVKRIKGKIGNPTVEVLKGVNAFPFAFVGLQQTWQNKELRNYALLRLLDQPVGLSAALGKVGFPTWYPTPNKNGVASQLAAQCVRLGLKVLLFVQSTRDTGAVAHRIDELVSAGSTPFEFNSTEKRLFEIAIEEIGSVEAAVFPSGCAGCHNANLIPVERELTESLFRRRGGINALAATPTLAQGMNLPADVVLIVGDERFNADVEGFSPLDPHELLNAAGRAGRAGLVAQGLVIVIPHTFVGFDPKTNQIDQKWIELQESVFSQTDQCLRLQDPIQHLLDRVQDVATESEPDVRYFLRRLPRGTDGAPNSPRFFLRSTLAAWHAKRSGEESKFEGLIEQALARRIELEPLVRGETWRDELAYRTGVAVEFIEALHSELLNTIQDPHRDTKSWVRWFFAWLGTDVRWIEAVFGHRLPKKLCDELVQGDLFGGRLADAVWAWMSGETLVKLNTRLGGKANRLDNCDKARKFVLKMIPDLAFAAGLATRIRRRQIDEDGGDMPLILATLALCIREGFGEPEWAALRSILAGEPMSRLGIIALWKKIEGFASPRKETEAFGTTKKRVSAALDRWRRKQE